MKKIYTLLSLCAATALTAQAETIRFVNSNTGAVIASGSTLNLSEVETSLFGELEVAAPVSVENVSAFGCTVQMDYTISQISNGDLSCCFPVNCFRHSEPGTYSNGTGFLEDGEKKPCQIEWIPIEEEYGTCSATFTVTCLDNNEKITLTINFAYSDPTSLQAVQAKAKGVKYYDLLGRETQVLKGVLIEKTTDGRCRKVRFN